MLFGVIRACAGREVGGEVLGGDLSLRRMGGELDWWLEHVGEREKTQR